LWDPHFASSGGRSPPGVDQVVSRTQAPGYSPAFPRGPSMHQCLASPLPQSFMERGITSHVAYDLSVRIVHGRFRASSRLGDRFSHA
jgi:hypothetical protein